MTTNRNRAFKVEQTLVQQVSHNV